MTALASTRHSSAKNIAFLVGLAITLLVTLLCAYDAFDGIELSTYDMRFKQRGVLPVLDDIILVTIDPTTVKDLNRKTTSISRVEYAAVIDELINRGAALIVFDMDFSSPSKDPEEDYALQQVIAENPGKVVMARYISQNQWVRPNHIFREAMVAVGQWDFSGKPDKKGNLDVTWEPDAEVDGFGIFMSEEEITDPYAENVMELEPVPAGQTFLSLAEMDPNIEYHFMILGHKTSDLLAGEGVINVKEDSDDRMRRVPMIVGLPEDPEKEAGLSLVAAAQGKGFLMGVEEDPDDIKKITIIMQKDEKEIRVPVIDGSLLINYAGPKGTFPFISFSKLLIAPENGQKLPDFTGKIVLIGNTHPTAHDEYPTPFDSTEGTNTGYTSGLEIHANALQTILSEQFIVKQDKNIVLLSVLILGLLVTVLWMFAKAFSIQGISALVIVTGAIVGVSFYLFKTDNYWLVTVPLVTVVIANFAGVMVVQTFGEYWEKMFIKGAWGMYLAPNVVELLIKDPDKLNLGGEEREMSALFSDIQSFSSISEKLTATELVKLLNEYLTLMCNEIMDFDGTIDKFEGDAIIAFFGAPIPFEDHAKKACLTAIGMKKANDALNKKLKAENRPLLHTRIGINSGKMVVGNMGSEQRMDYTIMGDAVNLAARLESGAKQYNVLLMISEDAYNQCKDDIEVRELDRITVVGKEKPTRIFELLAEKGGLDPKTKEAVAKFSEGLKLYRAQDWDGAVSKFSEADKIRGGDKPSLVFIDRCKGFRENPPDQNWDGVYRLTAK